MKQERGITLLSLVITIVVLVILASIGMYAGTTAVKSSQLTAFTTQLEMMQAEVDLLSQKKKNGDTSIDSIGQDISAANTEDITEAFSAVGETDTSGYKYYNAETIEDMGLEGIKREFLVNIDKRKVISIKPLDYNDTLYYTLEQLPASMYKVEHVEPESSNIDFNIKIEPLTASWKIAITDITYSTSYTTKGEIYYQKETDTEGTWHKIEGDSFEVRESGKYNVKVKDSTGQETVKSQYIYNKDGMILYYDGENNTGEGHSETATVWKDLSGNGNDGNLGGINNTSESGWASNNSLLFDGTDDYVVTSKDLDFQNSKQMTIEFVDLNGMLGNNQTAAAILFESSINSNQNEGSFYIDTTEFGTNEICLAMKYPTSAVKNHKMANGVITSGKTAIYTIVLDTTKPHNEYISIYKDGVLQNLELGTTNVEEFGDSVSGNISNKTISTYPFYIASRAGTSVFAKINLANLKVYNKALTATEVQINATIDKKRYGISD